MSVSRLRWLFALAMAAICAIAVYVLLGSGGDGAVSVSRALEQQSARVTVDEPQASLLSPGERVLVRAADPLTPRMDGRVYELSDDGSARRVGALECKQLHASPAGPGLCTAVKEDGRAYEGIVFDRDYRPRRRFAIDGVPDRVRVSPDGRLGAFSAFDRASSQGYFADTSGFSVDTRIVDLGTARTLIRLTKLKVTRAGKPFRPPQPQFWGVTFAGSDRFYATMATDYKHFLIEGDIRSGRARVLTAGIECPDVSPDGRRIAYKRRIRFSQRWRLYVLDLQTGRRTALAERRSIDDQPEWWGNDRILYSDDRAVFAVRADGSGTARRLIGGATSQAFLPDQ